MDHSDSVSGLERIEVGDSDPTQLFKQWMADFKKHNDDERLVYMNLATAHKDGTPSNRFVLLEDVVGDKFVFFTCDPSRKTSEIKENPRVSSCILFSYTIDSKRVDQQVRIEGTVRKLSSDQSRVYYDRKPVFCKIRSHLTHHFPQSTLVDWCQVKNKHDELFEKFLQKDLDLSMPESQSAYEITPTSIEFYAAHDHFIADRVKFTRRDDQSWEYCHLMA